MAQVRQQKSEGGWRNMFSCVFLINDVDVFLMSKKGRPSILLFPCNYHPPFHVI